MTSTIPHDNVVQRVSLGHLHPPATEEAFSDPHAQTPRRRTRIAITEREVSVGLDVPDNQHTMAFHWLKPDGPQIRVTRIKVTWIYKAGRSDVTYRISGPRILADGSEGNDLAGTGHSQNPPRWLADLVGVHTPDWFRS
ncbi:MULTISPECIES: hypothetical protein [unclassified Mycobacteroides]|uniref:hypothetical protein n=1 Tax=unclassified Mycobacteroides TaxID=2618759 RepID=UPI000A907727|nr:MULTISPECIES: hypothetical protein [unclassified Mycobacteroides]